MHSAIGMVVQPPLKVCLSNKSITRLLANTGTASLLGDALAPEPYSRVQRGCSAHPPSPLRSVRPSM